MNAVAEYVLRGSTQEVVGSVESILTHPRGLGLTTASPLQRAICRASEGIALGELWDDPTVRSAFGGVNPGQAPDELIVLSGIRSAKSMIASAIAIRATQRIDISNLKAGEIPRVSIVSLSRDLAQAPFSHMVGSILSSPVLSRLLVEEPTSESFVLMHPSGRPVEVRVVAGARAGSSVVSRWSAGILFDEAPRMQGQEDGVVNLDHTKAAVVGRLLPGAQVVEIGSPWAPFGPIYEAKKTKFGKPGPSLVIHAPAYDMNPYWWTKERCAKLRDWDITAYKTDVLAEFIDTEESMFPESVVTACTRPSPRVIPYENGCEYIAAMDPATRSNAWALVVATNRGGKKKIVYSKQWVPRGVPLRPAEVLGEISEILRDYQLTWCYTDQFSGDAMVDIAQRYGLGLVVFNWTASEKVRLFSNLSTQMVQGMVELPPDEVLTADLRRVRKVATQNGISIHLPTSSDGRHSDYAPPVALAVGQWIDEYQKPSPNPGDADYARYLEKKMEDEEIEAAVNPQTWWSEDFGAADISEW